MLCWWGNNKYEPKSRFQLKSIYYHNSVGIHRKRAFMFMNHTFNFIHIHVYDGKKIRYKWLHINQKNSVVCCIGPYLSTTYAFSITVTLISLMLSHILECSPHNNSAISILAISTFPIFLFFFYLWSILPPLALSISFSLSLSFSFMHRKYSHLSSFDSHLIVLTCYFAQIYW